ncbi:MAG: branched-chain amino acid ABC transporter ATP-binding protein [Desulfobacca sp.]|nr:branched-chain amino acid ABC transporter ATP-binding protein [Desulfobacca sp.]
MLELRRIGSGYKSLQVLWDIELVVRQGEWLALLGVNGAGKSTLLKTIAGLIKPFAGELRYQGNTINEIPVHERVALGISLVPEGRRLFKGMTVEENLLMGAFWYNDRKKEKEQMDHIMTIFPILKERRKQAVGTLSGGEQQMCSISRALMSQPRLLLIDELSLGLAPVVVDDLMETLISIKKSGVTLVVVEQDVYGALMYADRGYVIQEGRMIQNGEARELLSDPVIQKGYLGA